jgi:hypothetical protein
MNSKFSMLKSIALAAALAAGISGIARADDNSMSRFGGDGYAYFNSAPVSKAPSAWRQANPSGVSERELQALSSEGLGYDFQRPTFDKSPSAWRQANPNGVSERELQALSSSSLATAWRSPGQSATSALASTNGAAVVAKTAVK